jgi:hypothetical protein
MMGWMSRKLVGEMAGADEDFGLEVGVLFKPQLLIQLSMIHMDQIPDDPLRTINYHHLSGHIRT